MNFLTKIIIVFVLLLVILFVSLERKRTVSFDYIVKTDTYSEQDRQENPSDDSIEKTINVVNTNISETDTSFTPSNLEMNGKTSTDMLLNATANVLSLNYNTSSDSTSTNFDIARSESSETIYSEIIEVEKAIRKYISKGYKMSTLNTQNVKNAGYITEELSQKYDVTFRLSDGGYDIIISLKYSVPEEIKRELLSNKGLSLDGETIRYTFWIKAYR